MFSSYSIHSITSKARLYGIITHKKRVKSSPSPINILLRPLLPALPLLMHHPPRLVALRIRISRAQHLAHLPLDAVLDALSPVLDLASRLLLFAARVLLFACATQLVVAQRGAESLLCGAEGLVVCS